MGIRWMQLQVLKQLLDYPQHRREEPLRVLYPFPPIRSVWSSECYVLQNILRSDNLTSGSFGVYSNLPQSNAIVINESVITLRLRNISWKFSSSQIIITQNVKFNKYFTLLTKEFKTAYFDNIRAMICLTLPVDLVSLSPSASPSPLGRLLRPHEPRHHRRGLASARQGIRIHPEYPWTYRQNIAGKLFGRVNSELPGRSQESVVNLKGIWDKLNATPRPADKRAGLLQINLMGYINRFINLEKFYPSPFSWPRPWNTWP